MDEELKRTDAYATLTRNGKDVTPRQHCVIICSPDGIKLDRQLEFTPPSRPAIFGRDKGEFAVTYYTKPIGGDPILTRYIGRLGEGDFFRLSPMKDYKHG